MGWVLKGLVSMFVFAVWAGPAVSSDEGRAAGGSSGPTVLLKVPLADPAFDKVPVALVEEEPVTVRELYDALGAAHGDMGGSQKQAQKISPVDLVNRLVTAKLMVREAREIGLGELPEVKQELQAFSKMALKGVLREEWKKGVQADPKEVEELTKAAVKEYKIRSLMFEKEEDAKQMQADLQGGRDFDELVDRAIQDGKAKGDPEGNFVKRKDLQPEIETAVEKLEVGAVSPTIPVLFNRKPGFVILRLRDARYPEDPAARERAEKAALKNAGARAVQAQKEKFTKQNVKFHQKTIDALDYEAKKPTFEELLKDKRSLAEIKGEKPVTVGELTVALDRKFYHGADRAIESKRINKKKAEVLDSLVENRLYESLARKRGLDKTERYKDLVAAEERSLLFNLFVQKSIFPKVKVSDEDMRSYYEKNAQEFTYPEMARLRSLAFGTTAQAQQALEKLQRGADYNWVRANAEGQLKSDAKDLWRFEGTPILMGELPEEVQKAVTGSKRGDLRLCTDSEGRAYVLAVDELISPQRQPFDQAREEIRKRVFSAKLGEAVEDWAKKLRAASRVEIYVTEASK